MEFDLKVKILANGIQLPSYATAGSAGLDLRACISNSVKLDVNDIVSIPTGIAIQIPTPHIAGFIFARSGLASRHGINLVNGVGVIDSDYTGEIICVLQNVGKESYVINPGDRIAQIVFLPVALARLIEVDELLPTERGQGGFGSTGIN
ncbi:MAG: dUTP diphosphatase [Zhaonellaceae bacterium]|jgi:dUTP pyrophosphatase|nr:dUTP diphosphatase [Clostridia bacterium]